MASSTKHSGASHHDQGSFVTGLTVGMFAGAAGYFLFGTKRGASLLKQLEGEWESAKKQLVDEGIIETGDIKLKDFARGVINQVLGEMDQFVLPAGTPSSSKTSSKKSSKKSDSKPKKRTFKGV